MLSRIRKMLLIGLGVPVLVFVGLVIYEITIGLPESPSKEVEKLAILPSKSPSAVLPSKPIAKEVKKPIACLFTREPEETWPNETISDPPINNVELIKNFHIETYNVFGSNVYEVANSIADKGPAVKTYGKGVAGTKISIKGTWQPKNTAAGCIITEARVAVDIMFVLPEWVNKTAGSDRDQKMWDLYLKFIKRHEQGHINIAIKPARELQAELAQPLSAPSCPELSDKIKALFAVARQKKSEADDYYDKRTERGTTQAPHERNQTPYVFPFTCNWSEINI